MSKTRWVLSRGRIPRATFIEHLLHVLAGTLVLAAALLTTSCGLMANNSSQDTAEALTLSGTLPNGVTHQEYSAVLTVSGGSAPYQFSVLSGSLPPGMSLNPATGSLSGTPTAAGAYVFEIAVTDLPAPHRGSKSFSVSVKSDDSGSGVHVTVSPSTLNIVSGESYSFTATVKGTDNPGVTWAASAGSITSAGVYTAPSVSTATNATITATSKSDSKQEGVAMVVIEPAHGSALTITSSGLPDGRTGAAYDAAFTATGGTSPYIWSVSAGLPPGLSLAASTGELAGMPSAVGTYGFTVKVTDAKAQSVQKAFSVNVAASGNVDGPAELPRVTVSSTMADTLAPGRVIPVSAGGDLQAALNSAKCGDIVELQAGATFSGTFTLPGKSCDSNHWIIVRSSGFESVLSEGSRANPCFAGIRSLPGRPAYSCSNPQKAMARLEYSKTANGPIILGSGANYYRLVGLEITKTDGVRSAPTLISVTPGGLADHIVIDRSWLHGNTHDETQAGVSLNRINYAAVIDSYFSDFHCISGTGMCTDAHAVAGGLGNHQDGPWKIENNFLEASGEAILFGGGAATVTPADIEIRRNHFFKPWQWMPGSAGFVGSADGHPFIVKNHVELKNAMRVLIEANILENTWGGFTQAGYALLLCPKNQHTRGNGNVCPLCQVLDVTVRYTRIMHSGGGIAMSTAISGSHGNGSYALAGGRFSIHDVVIDDVNRKYVGPGTLLQISNHWPKNPLNTITINHITAFPAEDSHLISMGDINSAPPMYGFVFTNNIVMTGAYPVWNMGGGDTSCAYGRTPVEKISSCFKTYQFSNNALVAAPAATPPSAWPSGNFFPTTADAVDFTQYKPGGGGNYQLQSKSPFKGAGTDGRDLGADIAGLQAAIAGVE